MRLFRVSSLLLILSLLMTGCETDEPAVRYDPIVVWASYADEDYLPELFSEFTTVTGVPVTVRYERDEVHLYNLVENIGSEPADIYLTRNISYLVRAADEGALRPIRAEGLADVPDALKDTDGLWTAIGFQKTLIIQGSASESALPGSVLELADAAYQHKLCVASSKLATSLDMIAMMIADLGEKAAERVVRGWISNLAAAPFADESELLDAVESGDCEIAIVSGLGAGRIFSVADSALRAVAPQPGYLQVEALGVGRHSRYPQSAYLLIDWLLSADTGDRHALQTLVYPVHRFSESGHTGQPASTAGWRNEEARLLIERAGYR